MSKKDASFSPESELSFIAFRNCNALVSNRFASVVEAESVLCHDIDHGTRTSG